MRIWGNTYIHPIAGDKLSASQVTLHSITQESCYHADSDSADLGWAQDSSSPTCSQLMWSGWSDGCVLIVKDRAGFTTGLWPVLGTKHLGVWSNDYFKAEQLPLESPGILIPKCLLCWRMLPSVCQALWNIFSLTLPPTNEVSAVIIPILQMRLKCARSHNW